MTDVSCSDWVVTLKFVDLLNGEGGNIQADLVIAADGSRSSIRHLLAPKMLSKYAGYLTWRATIPEMFISEETQQAFYDRFTTYKMHKNYIVVYVWGLLPPTSGSKHLTFNRYVVPGESGSIQPGERQINFVSY